MRQPSNLSMLRTLLDITMHRKDLALFATVFMGLGTELSVPQRSTYDKATLAWHWHWQDAAYDVWRLWVLNRYCSFNNEQRNYLDEAINRRAHLFKTLQENKDSEGMVNIEESGMDCDCVSYSGSMHRIPATVYAYNKLYADTARWADGPFNFSIVSPKEAQQIEYKSRDNVMEAYEDGHPHSVVIRSPE